MDKASLEILIQDQPPDVQAKGVLLFNGVLQGKSAYQTEPVVSKLKDWKASEDALNEFINSISSTPINEKTFSGIPAVVEYLHGQGWKISMQTGYNHRGKKLLSVRKDGKYYQSDVDRYASGGALQRLDGIKQEVSDADSDRKRKAEADSAEFDARIKRIRAEAIEGKYIDREIFEEELAAQALAFRNSIQTYIHAAVEEIVSFIGGDVSKIPDLIEFMLERADDHFLKCAEEMERTSPPIDIDKIDADDEDDKDEQDEIE